MITFTQEPTIIQNPNPTVPLAAVVQFETSHPVETTLSIDDGRDRWKLHYGTDKSPAAGLPVVGMRADTNLNITVTIHDGDTQVTHPTPLTFNAPSLPMTQHSFLPFGSMQLTQRVQSQGSHWSLLGVVQRVNRQNFHRNSASL